MILGIYQILLVTAVLATAATVSAGVEGGVGGVNIGPRTGIIVSALVFVLWGLIAINSFEITVYSGGSSFTQSYESIAWLAVGGASIGLISMLQAALEEINNTGGL